MNRVVSLEADKILGEEIRVLDNGYLSLIDYMGSDKSVVRAARASLKHILEDNSIMDEKDEKLIRFLMTNGHTSPLEHVEVSVAIAMPIFVARQWMRHRTGSINEYSGRFVEMPNIFYVPSVDRIKEQSKMNKQGSGKNTSVEIADKFIYNLNRTKQAAYSSYINALEDGVAREIARLNLPLTQYTYFIWKMDLHNALHLLDKRMRPDAQWEIQQYAKAYHRVLKAVAPVTIGIWEETVLNGSRFSSKELEAIRTLLPKDLENHFDGLSFREKESLVEKLQRGI